MIKFLFIPLLIFNVLCGDTHYRFPDNRTAWLYDISHQLKKSHRITILSTLYSDPELSKKLIKKAQKGSKIHLLLQSPQGEPLSLVQYNNIDLYTTNTIPKYSIILFDQQLVCTSDTPIDYQITKRQFHCTNATHLIDEQTRILKSIMKQSDTYLK